MTASAEADEAALIEEEKKSSSWMFDGERLSRALVERLNEAKAKSLELSGEARARTIEFASEATKLGDNLAQRVKDAVATAPPPPPHLDEDRTRLLEEGEAGEDFFAGLANRVSDSSRGVTESVSSFGRRLGENSVELTSNVSSNIAGFSKRVGDNGAEISANVAESVTGFSKRVGDNSKEFANVFTSSMADTRECGLTRSQRFRWYVILLCTSTLFFGLSFQLVINPTKFATTFAFGTITSISAKAMLNGPYTQLRLMFQLQKLPYTLALLASTFTTLYLCFSHANTLLILVAACAQIAALLYYLFGDTPGGKAGIKLLFKLIVNTARLITRPFFYALE